MTILNGKIFWLTWQAKKGFVFDLATFTQEKEFSYNNIKQYNRNSLLWDRSLEVDGIKTGHTSEAGFSLITSASREGMRLISVVMGTASEQARAASAPFQRLRKKQTLSRSVIGMTLAHIGVGVFAIGVTVTQTYRIEKDFALMPGQSVGAPPFWPGVNSILAMASLLAQKKSIISSTG